MIALSNKPKMSCDTSAGHVQGQCESVLSPVERQASLRTPYSPSKDGRPCGRPIGAVEGARRGRGAGLVNLKRSPCYAFTGVLSTWRVRDMYAWTCCKICRCLIRRRGGRPC